LSFILDVDSIYQNLETIAKLWRIDDKISNYILSLDKESGGDTYFLRYLLVSISRMLPGRIDLQRFRMLYDETLARGRAEIIYTDSRDWVAARHGVTAISKIVSCDDLKQELDRLEKDGYVVLEGDVKIIDSPDPARAHPELAELSYNKVYQELTAMLNILQRPFRIQSIQSVSVAYQWWRGETDLFLDADYDELLGFEYSTLQYGDMVKKLEVFVSIRENLQRFINDTSLEDNIRVATLIFDKYVSVFMKQLFMDYAGYLSKPLHDMNSSRLNEQVKAQDNIISALNCMVQSLVMDRYVPHRIWAMPAILKPMQFDLNRSYDQLEMSEAERFKQELMVIEKVIDDIIKSMHGEEFEIGAETVPFADIIYAKINAYPEIYQQIVSEKQSIFPNLDFLIAHLLDSNIALSPLRQIEVLKDTLKMIARVRFPGLYYDSAGTVQFLEQLRESVFSVFVYNFKADFSKADQETAKAADGALVVSVVSYDETRDILVLAKPAEDRINIIKILTPKEGSPFLRISEPLMSASFSNGVAFSGQIGRVLRYSALPNSEKDIAGKFIIHSSPSPDILSLLGQGEPAGVICDTGGATSHLAGVLRERDIPVLSATDSSVYNLLFEGMPIQVVGNNIYAFVYLYRKGDLGKN
jgi:phosphohistidine swiveling domain-containing protein